jgi:hypothetical protein
MEDLTPEQIAVAFSKLDRDDSIVCFSGIVSSMASDGLLNDVLENMEQSAFAELQKEVDALS